MTVNRTDLQLKKQQAIHCYSIGDLVSARRLCEDICRHDQSDAEVFCLRGIVSAQLNQFDEAVQHTRKATMLSPGYLEAHFHLGSALGELGKLEEAADRLEYVIGKRSDYPNAYSVLAFIKVNAGDYKRALECYRMTRQLDPDDLAAVAGETEMLEKLGKDKEAMDVVRPYISSHRGDAETALAYAGLARKRGEIDAAIDCLEPFLHTHEVLQDTRMRLHFMLGHLYDDAGRFDEAFRFFTEANKLKGVYFNSADFRLATDRQIERFGNPVFDTLPRSGSRSELPVFIVGMPRSGSSLVEQILSSHAGIHGAGELDDVREITAELFAGSRPDAELASVLTVDRLARAAEKYINKISALSPASSRVTDKMPGNYFSLGLIELMFPNARIIHCMRDPLDTCLSCYFQNFPAAHAYAFGLEDLGRYYLQYRKLMEHWKAVLNIPIYEVTYEELIGDSRGTIERLVGFCGLDWDERCLKHEKNERIVSTASHQQARRKIYTSSVARWRNYEKHLAPLRGILGDTT